MSWYRATGSLHHAPHEQIFDDVDSLDEVLGELSYAIGYNTWYPEKVYNEQGDLVAERSVGVGDWDRKEGQ